MKNVDGGEVDKVLRCFRFGLMSLTLGGEWLEMLEGSCFGFKRHLRTNIDLGTILRCLISAATKAMVKNNQNYEIAFRCVFNSFTDSREKHHFIGPK